MTHDVAVEALAGGQAHRSLWALFAAGEKVFAPPFGVEAGFDLPP